MVRANFFTVWKVELDQSIIGSPSSQPGLDDLDTGSTLSAPIQTWLLRRTLCLSVAHPGANRKIFGSDTKPLTVAKLAKSFEEFFVVSSFSRTLAQRILLEPLNLANGYQQYLTGSRNATTSLELNNPSGLDDTASSASAGTTSTSTPTTPTTLRRIAAGLPTPSAAVSFGGKKYKDKEPEKLSALLTIL
ncbi:hypothetical protein G7Y89_g4236 [Cudoniella acicularis]|uniref:Uncharacterized protein n=1 Tax=Cudoniella acicularis TaxID=354080 RepID=A0A8H4RSU4_9HELO|nr:hypothetical protein G7Y89_g4236 [Cudoniella acicularis]